VTEDPAQRGSDPERSARGGSPLEEPMLSTHETLERDAAGAALAHAAEEGVVGTSPLERTGAEADGLALEPERELMTINMGPHHPATHGVLRLVVELEGEVVKDLKPVVGYVHTGIEKNCEDKSYWKVIPFVERMDYLSYFFNMQSFCSAVETLLDLEVPKRAQYLRVIHMELNRLHSHLVWLGTSALDLGAMSMFFYCFRDRDRVLDLFEMSSGQRMHTRYFQVGGVFEDIPAGFDARLRAFCQEMPSRVDQYMAILDENEIFVHRTRHVSVVPSDRLLALGVTGPLLRAAGEPWDLRKAEPYSSYEDFDFKIPIGTVGDGYDRYRVRVQEMRESVRIIEQALDGLPEGPWIADDRKVVLPPRHELSTSMEALIHHFKLVTEGFRVPPGEAYAAVEGPRGELGCFLLADGSAKPARVHIRDPSFVNLQALREMAVGGYIADLIQSLAMLDPILGGVDR
jgi:NADH-quinone oxidoreductase subunit D